jgi:hypothetical protein
MRMARTLTNTVSALTTYISQVRTELSEGSYGTEPDNNAVKLANFSRPCGGRILGSRRRDVPTPIEADECRPKAHAAPRAAVRQSSGG